MGTYTSRLGLFLPAGSDAADIATIIAAWQKLDGTSGLILCTEATKPTTNKFPGMYIKCTDSGKHYYLDGTGSWTLGTYTGGVWIEDAYTNVGTAGISYIPRTSDASITSTAYPPTVADSQLVLALVPGTYDIELCGTYTNTGVNNRTYFKLSHSAAASSAGFLEALGLASAVASGDTSAFAGVNDYHTISSNPFDPVAGCATGANNLGSIKLKATATVTASGNLSVLTSVSAGTTTFKTGTSFKAVRIA